LCHRLRPVSRRCPPSQRATNHSYSGTWVGSIEGATRTVILERGGTLLTGRDYLSQKVKDLKIIPGHGFV
jgi:hypothetical protein